jgi:hypothetical protein
MIKGEKWVMGGKELRHLFFLDKKPCVENFVNAPYKHNSSVKWTPLIITTPMVATLGK